MSDEVKQSSVMARLFGSRKFWIAFSSGIVTVGAQVLPLISMFCGWDANKQAAFTSACNGISSAVAGLGGILVVMVGAEDSAHKLSLPPPSQPSNGGQ